MRPLSQYIAGWNKVRENSGRINCITGCKGECLFDELKRHLTDVFLSAKPTQCYNCNGNTFINLPARDLSSVDIAEHYNFQPVEYFCGNSTWCPNCEYKPGPDIKYIKIECEEKCQGECVETKLRELTTGGMTKSARKV